MSGYIFWSRPKRVRVRMYLVTHAKGVTPYRAPSKAAALQMAKQQFGSDGGPFKLFTQPRRMFEL